MDNIIIWGKDDEAADHDDLFPREKVTRTPSSTEKKVESDIPQDILDSMDKALADAQAMLKDQDNLDTLEVTACRARVRAVKALRKAKLTKTTLKKLDDVKGAMDESHQGMRELKDQLLEQANYALRTGVTPRPMLLIGAPGCGKTSLSLSFAKALGQGYSMISVGGETGSFPLCGSDVGWKGARQGKIMDTFLDTGSLNPVIIIDEIDKMGTSQQYGTPADALLPVLEKEQARLFKDRYLTFSFDISHAWIILTANYIGNIPEPVLDLCNVIQMPSFDLTMKEDIFKRLVMKKNKEIAPSSITVSDDAVEHIVTSFCGDYGARGVTKCVDRLFERVATDFPKTKRQVERQISGTEAKELFQRKPMESHYDFSKRPGLVSGLAVTTVDYSGLIMPVEAEVLPSCTMGLTVTGQAKSVMQESAMIAVRLADRISQEKRGKRIGEVSVNYPYAVEKDGDSAGLATTIAILSSAWQSPINPKTAITGSVTLSGQVLAVGGIMAKVKAPSMPGTAMSSSRRRTGGNGWSFLSRSGTPSPCTSLAPYRKPWISCFPLCREFGERHPDRSSTSTRIRSVGLLPHIPFLFSANTFKRRIKNQTITLHAGDDGSNRTSLSFKKDNGATMKKANGLFKMLGKADAQYGIER